MLEPSEEDDVIVGDLERDHHAAVDTLREDQLSARKIAGQAFQDARRWAQNARDDRIEPPRTRGHNSVEALAGKQRIATANTRQLLNTMLKERGREVLRARAEGSQRNELQKFGNWRQFSLQLGRDPWRWIWAEHMTREQKYQEDSFLKKYVLFMSIWQMRYNVVEQAISAIWTMHRRICGITVDPKTDFPRAYKTLKEIQTVMQQEEAPREERPCVMPEHTTKISIVVREHIDTLCAKGQKQEAAQEANYLMGLSLLRSVPRRAPDFFPTRFYPTLNESGLRDYKSWSKFHALILSKIPRGCNAPLRLPNATKAMTGRTNETSKRDLVTPVPFVHIPGDLAGAVLTAQLLLAKDPVAQGDDDTLPHHGIPLCRNVVTNKSLTPTQFATWFQKWADIVWPGLDLTAYGIKYGLIAALQLAGASEPTLMRLATHCGATVNRRYQSDDRNSLARLFTRAFIGKAPQTMQDFSGANGDEIQVTDLTPQEEAMANTLATGCTVGGRLAATQALSERTTNTVSLSTQQAQVLQTMESRGVTERDAKRILREALRSTTRSLSKTTTSRQRTCQFHACSRHAITTTRDHGATLCKDHLELVQPHVGAFEVRISTIPGAGLGLFATRTVHSPYNLHYKGKRLTKKQVTSLPKDERAYVLGHANKFIDASHPMSCLARYINHSSTNFNVQMIPAQGDHYIVQVIDEIKKGCEVFSNYQDAYWGGKHWAGDHQVLSSQTAMSAVQPQRRSSPRLIPTQRETRSDDSDFEDNHPRVRRAAHKRKRGRPSKQAKAAKKTKKLAAFFHKK